jgi:hypothetical protein
MSKINQIGKQLGRTLIGQGMSVLAKSIKTTPKIMTSIEVRGEIEKYLDVKLVFLDGKYKIIPWEQWREIDEEIYQITKKKYVSQFADCDDRAYITKYFTQQIFGISQFIAHGHCYDMQGKWLFGHFWDMKLTPEGLYAYEPIGNEWTKVEKKQQIVMKDRIYKPLTLEF